MMELNNPGFAPFLPASPRLRVAASPRPRVPASPLPGPDDVLRTTLPAEDWKQESVVEWTDTTHTALRYRNTRFMTAHVAAKGADSKVYLHAVHLASDRQTDGSWGSLYGHIMWSDWMAEKNVNEDPPSP